MQAPRLWRCLVQEWIPLNPDLAHAWWFALDRAQWTLAREWRDAFVAKARQDGWLSAEAVEAFFTQQASPPVLFGLLAALTQEGVLLRREQRAIEAALLAQLNAQGAWTHPRRAAR